MAYRRLTVLTTLLAVLLVWAVTARAGDPVVTIEEMTITTRLVGGDPVDSVFQISSTSPKTLYCFTRVASPDDTEREITHVWYRDGEVIGNLTLPVKGERWRTYSKKTIGEGMNGLWRVEARDAAGNLLKTVEFRVN